MFTRGYPQIVKEFNALQIVDNKVNTVYHYTSPNGLKGIIENKKLWLTDRGFLNDSSEEQFTLQILKKAISKGAYRYGLKEYILRKCSEMQEKLLHRTQRAYIVSFSTSGDNLCLWNYYTKGNSFQGYSLGFDPVKLKSALNTSLNSKDIVEPISGKVIYIEKDQLNLLKEIIDRLSQSGENLPDSDVGDLILDKVLIYGYLFKDSCFSIEKEYRIVYPWDLRIARDKYNLPDDCYRELNGFFVPYIKMPINGECVRSVTISPTVDYELAKSCLSRMLKKDFPNTAISKSRIPVRY